MSISRRSFLRGIGGFTLALPFLPSLLTPRSAAAATVGMRRYVQFATEHGGVWANAMFPAESTLTERIDYAGHSVRRGDLRLEVEGETARLSRVLAGPASVLTPALARKMNVLRGLDVPFYIAHHTGGHLGNFARNDGNGSDGVFMQNHPTPTIDQIMAWSPKFYESLGTIRERSLQIGPGLAWGFANPQARSGPIQAVSSSTDALDLFERIFVASGGPEQPQLGPVVDRVNADYKRLREGDRRLSADDRRRLDDHMQRLAELERRLRVRPSCDAVVPVTTDTQRLMSGGGFPQSPSDQATAYGVLNDVIVAALMCDTSRIATVRVNHTFSSHSAELWHNDIAHQAHAVQSAQDLLRDGHQRTFAATFLDLAAKLDVDDGSGQTLLDSCLLVWSQESGQYTHDAQDMPVLTAGGAGGALRTGSYCDYRNRNITARAAVDRPDSAVHPGLLWHQWLGTAMQLMGLDRADFEANGVAGYPQMKYLGENFWGSATAAQMWPDRVWNVAGEVLPFLRTT